MYLIRADGNAEIGAGHLMRCLTIADALRKHVGGSEILFVCADSQSAGQARRRGYGAFVLGSDPRDMEGELFAWPRIPGLGEGKHVILIDSYFVTNRYLRAVREYGAVTLLDDMGEECFPVDRIINYNAFADRKQYESLYRDSDAELILGSTYVPVRPQFRGEPYEIRDRVEHILITTGGGDADNIAGRILQRVRELAADRTEDGLGHGVGIAEGVNYHLVMGSFNPHFAEMKALEKRLSHVHIHHDVQDMAGLMRRCDLAVTAGGSTVYELAAVGVPFICFSYAENQEKMTEYLRREKIAFSAGAYHKNPEAVLGRIAEQVAMLAAGREKRGDCCFRERRLTDGWGAERLAELLARGVTTKAATGRLV